MHSRKNQPKVIDFLKNNFFPGLASIGVTIALSFLIYNLFEQTPAIKKSVNYAEIDSLGKQILLLKNKTDSMVNLLHKFNLKDTNINFNSSNYITQKFSSIDSKQNFVEDKINELRQAINPLKPDEVLTIARLKDDIINLNKDFSSLSENQKSKQKAFEESVRQEMNSSNQSTTLIIVILTPLVLNFLYTVWKDFKKPDKKEKEV